MAIDPDTGEQRTVTIGFDIGHTLDAEVPGTTDDNPICNEDVRRLLVFLSGCKNTRIHVWSSQGAYHARDITRKFALESYVDSYGAKKKVTLNDGRITEVSADGTVVDIAVDNLDVPEVAPVLVVVPWGGKQSGPD